MIVVAGVIVAGALLLSFSQPKHVLVKSAAVPSNGASFHYKCNTADKQSLGCLEQKYADMTSKQDAAVSFAALKTAYATDATTKSDCHQLAHAIGRAEADTVNDVAQAYALGDNFCWSGYYHGVMESIVTRIGTTKLTANLALICAPLKAQKPYSFAHYNCVHGLGHGIMDIDDSQLFSALKTCDSLTSSWERQSCYGGTFMENEMDEVNPDHKTAYLKADEPMYPCTAVDATYKYQCYLMQTSHALKLASNDFAQVFGECAVVESNFAAVCYQSLGRDASGNSISQVEPTKTSCMYGPDQTARENCIIGAVKDFVSYYHGDQQATQLCNALDSSLQPVCQTTTDSYYKTL
jgi:hypothetical protein